MKQKKEYKHLIKGSISSGFIAQLISKHQTKNNLGAHSIFLGQVRKDTLDGKRVKAIDYSAYKEMAEKEIMNIKENILHQKKIDCLHIFHSTGTVNIGEISLFVMVSAAHRQDTFTILQDVVERIKLQVPIWKKEVYDDGSKRWIKEKIS